jgi:DNA-binding transcriptional LysR family regulator
MPQHTFRDISLFVAAYEERSFTAAARRENATQSGVSQHIRKLETGFGVALFERLGGAVVPTPAGDRYYHHCISILRASDEARAQLGEFGPGQSGNLHVGLMPTVTRFCLSGPLIASVRQNPNARINVIEGFSSDLTARVNSSELDFAIVPLAEPQVGLRTTPFATIPEVLACGKRSPLFGRRTLSPGDLNGVSLVVPTERNIRRRMIDGFLREHDVHPHSFLELDSMMGTLDMIRRSDHVSILPVLLLAGELRAPEDHPTLSIARISSADLESRLVVLERSRAAIDPLGRAFCAALKAECDNILSDLR